MFLGLVLHFFDCWGSCHVVGTCDSGMTRGRNWEGTSYTTFTWKMAVKVELDGSGDGNVL